MRTGFAELNWHAGAGPLIGGMQLTNPRMWILGAVALGIVALLLAIKLLT